MGDERPFEIGDVVRLKAGGRKMTVCNVVQVVAEYRHLRPDQITCRWQTRNGVERKTVCSAAELDLVPAEKKDAK